MEDTYIWHKFVPSDSDETVLCWSVNGAPVPVPVAVSITAIDAYVTCEACLELMKK